jgi:hypothetical protein
MTKRKKKRARPEGRLDSYPAAPAEPPEARKAWMDKRSQGIGERGAAAAADAVDGGTIGEGKGKTS